MQLVLGVVIAWMSVLVAAVPCSSPEAYRIPDGRDYRGTKNITVSGKVCQYWDSQVPQQHQTALELSDGLGHHNFCRNPFRSNLHPGCFTVDPQVRYEMCDVGSVCTMDSATNQANAVEASPIPSSILEAPLTVTLSTTTPGATIRYTLDGSIPSVDSGTVYTAGGFVLNGDGTVAVTAVAFHPNFMASDPRQFIFVLEYAAMPQVAILPQPTSIVSSRPVLVVINPPVVADVPQPTVRYTIDGTVPDQTSTLYDGPFWLKETTTVSARAFGKNHRGSAVTSTQFFLNVARAPAPTVTQTNLPYGRVKFELSSALKRPFFTVSLNESTRQVVAGNTFVLNVEGRTTLDFSVEDENSIASSPSRLVVSVSSLPTIHLSQTPGIYHHPIAITASTEPALPLVVIINGQRVSSTFSLSNLGTYIVECYVKVGDDIEGAHRIETFALTSQTMDTPVLNPDYNSPMSLTSPFFVTVLAAADPKVTFEVSIDGGSPSIYPSSGTTIQLSNQLPSARSFKVSVKAVGPSKIFDLDSPVLERIYTVYPEGSESTGYFRIQHLSDSSSFSGRLGWLFGSDSQHIEVRPVSRLVTYLRFVRLPKESVSFYAQWAFQQLALIPTVRLPIGISFGSVDAGCLCLIKTNAFNASIRDVVSCEAACGANQFYSMSEGVCRCFSSVEISAAVPTSCSVNKCATGTVSTPISKILPVAEINGTYVRASFALSWAMSSGLSLPASTTSTEFSIVIQGLNFPQATSEAKFVPKDADCSALSSTFSLLRNSDTAAGASRIIVRREGDYELCVRFAGNVDFDKVPHALGNVLKVSPGRNVPIAISPADGSYELGLDGRFVVSITSVPGSQISISIDGVQVVSVDGPQYNLSVTDVGLHTLEAFATISATGDVASPQSVTYNLFRRVVTTSAPSQLPPTDVSFVVLDRSAQQFRVVVNSNISLFRASCSDGSLGCNLWIADTKCENMVSSAVAHLSGSTTDIISLKSQVPFGRQALMVCVATYYGSMELPLSNVSVVPLSTAALSPTCSLAQQNICAKTAGCAVAPYNATIYTCLCANERAQDKLNAYCDVTVDGLPQLLTFVTQPEPPTIVPVSTNASLPQAPDYSTMQGSWSSLIILALIFGVSFVILCYLKRPRTDLPEKELPSAPKQAFNWVVHGQRQDQNQKLDVYAMQVKGAAEAKATGEK